MPIGKYQKQDIARIQLERAIHLYLEDSEFFSALTLAGAAEEILGQLLRARGLSAALDDIKKRGILIGQVLFGEPMDERTTVTIANRSRNQLKHHNPKADTVLVFDPREEAKDMINRAIDNYFRLAEDLTNLMLEFQNHEHA